jgi:hypothetical protein
VPHTKIFNTLLFQHVLKQRKDAGRKPFVLAQNVFEPCSIRLLNFILGHPLLRAYQMLSRECFSLIPMLRPDLGRGLVAHEHPVVLPHVLHLRHVPFRTKVKFPHSPQASPS